MPAPGRLYGVFQAEMSSTLPRSTVGCLHSAALLWTVWRRGDIRGIDL
jgi:hypothetical protein